MLFAAIEIVSEHDCNVIECNVKTKTKGDVLKFAFNKLKNKDIDAYVIFDADNVVHHDFLIHMNNCLGSGYRVAQSYRDSKNPSDNWLSGSYTLFYLMQNVFFNRSRMGLNASSSINGTGFMIKKELIDLDGFKTYTLTEDVEFAGQCALKDEKIAFIRNAITYDEYPTNFKVSWIQRKRWTTGNIGCMKIYSWKLFKHFLKTKKLAPLDMSLSYLAPIMTILCFINALLTTIFQVLKFNVFGVIKAGLFGILIIFALSYLLSIIIELLVFVYEGKKIKPVLSGIVLFSVFTLTWIPINMLCLIKKETTWKEIKHTRSIAINEVLDK